MLPHACVVTRTHARDPSLEYPGSTVMDKDKEEVTEYFNTNGFERWNKIYSDSDEVNDVQKDIRTGHGQTIDKVGGLVVYSWPSYLALKTRGRGGRSSEASNLYPFTDHVDLHPSA